MSGMLKCFEVGPGCTLATGCVMYTCSDICFNTSHETPKLRSIGVETSTTEYSPMIVDIILQVEDIFGVLTPILWLSLPGLK